MDKRQHKRRFSIKNFQVHSRDLLKKNKLQHKFSVYNLGPFISSTSIYNLGFVVLDNISADQSVTKKRTNINLSCSIYFSFWTLPRLRICMFTRSPMSAREATSTRLADEGVFIFRLGYVVDIQHLHRPLFFRCKKAAEIPRGGTCKKLKRQSEWNWFHPLCSWQIEGEIQVGI